MKTAAFETPYREDGREMPIDFVHLEALMYRDQEEKGNVTWERSGHMHWRQIQRFFGKYSFTCPETDRCNVDGLVGMYKRWRLKGGIANATVQREISMLGRMFRLAYEDGSIPHRHYFKTLPRKSPRRPCLPHNKWLELKDSLPFYLRNFAEFMYLTGWDKSAIINMTVDHIDPKERKTKPPYPEIRLEGRLWEIVSQQFAQIEETNRKAVHDRRHVRFVRTKWLFHKVGVSNSRDGERIQDPRFAWHRVCSEVGLKGFLMRDLVGVAIRRMWEQKVPINEIMRRVGLKSTFIFYRLGLLDSNIVSDCQTQSS